LSRSRRAGAVQLRDLRVACGVLRAARMRKLLLGFVLACGACGADHGDSFSGGGEGVVGGGGGGFGATPGGEKDIDQARAIINAGGVPSADQITVEGMLSQHDLPGSGAPCDALFCAQPALAWAPSLETGANALWLSLGMASNVDPAHPARPPLDLVAVVDDSPSMAIDIAQVDATLAGAIDHLRPGDRFAEVRTGSGVYLPLAEVSDPATVKAQINAVGANGGGSLISGLMTGDELAAPAAAERRMGRVLLFTCGYPDASGGGAFATVAKNYADRGVGLSLFGVLLGFDSELAHVLAPIRGANYYFLTDLVKVSTVLDDFDAITTPLAYDLDVALSFASGVAPARSYGIPGDATGAPATSLHVNTIFPSRGHGAIVLRLDAGAAPPPAAAGSVALTYVSANDGATYGQTAPLSFAAAAPSGGTAPPPATATYDGPGVHEAVLLVNLAVELKAACADVAAGQKTAAIARLDALITYATPEVTTIPDAANELALAQKLRSNISH
jgi:hypothetical protein